MTHVAVLVGGTSAEREVSLRSGAAVEAALKAAGYNATSLDPAELDKENLLRALQKCDVVFPVLHGLGGEDGTLQTWLEEHDLCFIGADSRASAICFDKWRYKEMIAADRISMPAAELVTRETIWESSLTDVPYVLKPIDEGSSVDTFIIRDPAAADKSTLEAAFERHQTMLLEELIEGIEITVGVLGDDVLPVIEIIPPSGGEFDFANKYNGQSQELCPPQHVDAALQQEAQDITRRIHTSLNIKDVSRTDMIIRASDNTLFVLETNTSPGLTDQSLLPKAAAVAGYDMSELTSMLVEDALARRTKK